MCQNFDSPTGRLQMQNPPNRQVHNLDHGDTHTPPQTTPNFLAITGDHLFKIDMRAPLAMVSQRLSLYCAAR